MKKFLCLFIFLLCVNSLFISPVYCWDIKDRNEYLLDVRGDDGDIILNRITLHNQLKSPELEMTAFSEAQWNIGTSEWEKITMGAEIGKYVYKWLYLGQSLQFMSGEMLDYMAFEVDNRSIDSTTKIAIGIPIIEDLCLRLFEEYSINIEKGKEEYCEIGIELNYDIRGYCSIGIGWRHTDRIHNFDSDYISSSIILNF
ncbi:MAG: hypothetical protein KKB52_00100 [Candidatus Omnitrophica bacterium]|nr:hypothetical protein [Candidatus Omnitrophota bacterium]